jgi:hypothetical protein
MNVGPAGTYINCVEEGENTICLKVGPAGTYINSDEEVAPAERISISTHFHIALSTFAQKL